MIRGMIEMMIVENYVEMNVGEIVMVNVEIENAIGRICVIVICVIERIIVIFFVNVRDSFLFYLGDSEYEDYNRDRRKCRY